MEYNIEKINQIGKMLAEVIEEAVQQTEAESVRIGNLEMALRENLLVIGQSALKQFLENADGKLEAEIECACGGKLKYQRRRAATIWSVFGKVVYKRAYYAGCTCQNGCAPVDRCYGIEAGKVTAGLAHLIALSGIKESFDEGRKWLKEYLLFEVSENTIRSETQKMGELQRQADQALVKAMQDEKSLHTCPGGRCQGKRERSQPIMPDILYGSVDAAKVRIEPRDPQEKAVENRETWRDLKAGCWYEGEVVPVRQQSTRQKEKAQREGVVLRARNKKYFCDIAEAKEFGKLLWATGCAVGADRAPVGFYLRWRGLDLEFDCPILSERHSNCRLVSRRRPFETHCRRGFSKSGRTPNLADAGHGRLMARKSRISYRSLSPTD
jgi:hypothetical protein